jgi:hypothetical protein
LPRIYRQASSLRAHDFLDFIVTAKVSYMSLRIKRD